MEELKKQLKELALSDETYRKITKIGDKHNLMIDEQGELAAKVQDVIMGFVSSKDFIKTLKEELEIGDEKANVIAVDVNTEIFEAIRDKLQQIQAQKETAEMGTAQNPTVTTTTPTPTEVKQMISSVEKAGNFMIDNSQPQSSSPQYKEEGISKEEILKKIEDEPVPLVDHLLTTPVIKPEIKEEKKTYTTDPYREQI